MRYLPTQEEKVAIGKKVAELYFKLPPKKRPFLYRVESKEPDGIFRVWSYPVRFVHTIDSVIKELCKNKAETPKRKRITAKRVTPLSR